MIPTGSSDGNHIEEQPHKIMKRNLTSLSCNLSEKAEFRFYRPETPPRTDPSRKRSDSSANPLILAAVGQFYSILEK
jgi:hypothetical protein